MLLKMDALCLVVSIGIIAKTMAYLTMRHNFVKQCQDDSAIPSGLIIQPSSSRLDCARMCQETDGCKGINIRDQGLECQLVMEKVNCTNAVTQTGGEIFGKEVWCNPPGGTKVNDACDCNRGYYGDSCQYIVKDCYEAVARGWTAFEDFKKTMTILPVGASRPYIVGCLPVIVHVGYASVMSRMRDNCLTDFDDLDTNLSWKDYKYGFGTDTRCNHFSGLEALYHLAVTNKPAGKDAELIIKMAANYVVFSQFTMTDEVDGYRATFVYDTGKSNAPDSVTSPANPAHSVNGMQFSTYDQDNDLSASNCAQTHGSGWWYNDCAASNLFGSGTTTGRPNPIFYEGISATDLYDSVEIYIGYV